MVRDFPILPSVAFMLHAPHDCCTDLLEMAFSKTKSDQRKEWLMKSGEKVEYIDHSADLLSYTDFINKELVQFSMADNIRSIPSAVDGMKPSQRKVLFCCFKRKLTEEVKVAQLAGYVSEHSAYHHGEASLHGTIINMAQDYCGSNNVNLLVPSGQFGTRLLGGKDAASPQYIFTKLDSLARLVFHKDDDALIKYRDDDGMSIEPHHYVPVIPMILVNGCDGIGKMLASILCVRGPRVFTMIEPRVSTMIEIVTTGSQELVGAHQFQTTIRLMLLRTFVGFSTVTR